MKYAENKIIVERKKGNYERRKKIEKAMKEGEIEAGVQKGGQKKKIKTDEAKR